MEIWIDLRTMGYALTRAGRHPSMDKRDKRLTYLTTCRRNPTFPKVRLLCGEVQRILSPDGTLECLVNNRWQDYSARNPNQGLL